MISKIPIAVIGATGYTGQELVRLLVNHPRVSIVALTSRHNKGERYDLLFPSFQGFLSSKVEALNVPEISRKVKLVFLCLPHHEAMDVAKQFRSRGVRVIDLSADFRLKNSACYEQWYGKHSQKKLLSEAVYGLPELHQKEIAGAKLLAAPGCYATANILALAPLVAGKMILVKGIICDSKSGASGAGRSLKIDILYGEVNESIKPYKIGVHRHTPEIEQELSLLAKEPVQILFSPHLVPMDRGILSTVYCTPVKRWSVPQLIGIFKKFYGNSRFIKILPYGVYPQTKNVRGTNNCHIGIFFCERTEKIVVMTALDNLTKGASGQAVQCFNLMFGIAETTGLECPGFIP